MDPASWCLWVAGAPVSGSILCRRFLLAREGQGCARRISGTAASDRFQSSRSKPVPSQEANKGAMVTAWGSNHLISPLFSRGWNFSHTAVEVVGETLRSLNPDSWLCWLALCLMQNYIWTLSRAPGHRATEDTSRGNAFGEDFLFLFFLSCWINVLSSKC